MKLLPEFPALRIDRHASAMLHDEPNFRVAAFTLAPHQEVAVHTSTSSVLVTVVRGCGLLEGAEGRIPVQAGETVAYAPNEPHGMQAGKHGMEFVAVIVPGPSGIRIG